MTLTPNDVDELDTRARAVGAAIGQPLRFIVAPNPEYVGLAVGPDWIIVEGPFRLSDLAVYEIEFVLDALEAGTRRIVPDEDGDPRLT